MIKSFIILTTENYIESLRVPLKMMSVATAMSEHRLTRPQPHQQTWCHGLGWTRQQMAANMSACFIYDVVRDTHQLTSDMTLATSVCLMIWLMPHQHTR